MALAEAWSKSKCCHLNRTLAKWPPCHKTNERTCSHSHLRRNHGNCSCPKEIPTQCKQGALQHSATHTFLHSHCRGQTVLPSMFPPLRKFFAPWQWQWGGTSMDTEVEEVKGTHSVCSGTHSAHSISCLVGRGCPLFSPWSYQETQQA